MASSCSLLIKFSKFIVPRLSNAVGENKEALGELLGTKPSERPT